MDDNSAVRYFQSNCTIAETPSPSLDRPPLSYIQEQFNRNQYPANGKIVENITARKWKSILDGKSSLNHDNNPLECTFCDFFAENVDFMLSHLDFDHDVRKQDEFWPNKTAEGREILYKYVLDI